jgi:hypothetical protein
MIVKTLIEDGKIFESEAFYNLTDFVEKHNLETVNLYFVEMLIANKSVYVYFKSETEFEYSEDLEVLSILTKSKTVNGDMDLFENENFSQEFFDTLTVLDRKIKINKMDINKLLPKIVWVSDFKYNYYDKFFLDINELKDFEISELEKHTIKTLLESGQSAYIHFTKNGLKISHDRNLLKSLVEVCENDFENENVVSDGVETTIQKIRKTCKNTFLGKLKEYGATWLYYRTPSMLEQIESKLNRLKNKVLIVNETRLETWQSIYNYCLIVLMMNGNRIDYNDFYKELSENCENIRIEKNKDYSDSWQAFHEQTIIDIAFAKLKRISNIVNHDNENVLTEKHISDIIDVANYAIYGAFKNS